MAEVRDIIIVGSGPAGLTAAIYAGRANLRPLVIEGGGSGPQGNLPGGQLMWTTEVENYSGFENGIMGPELMSIMRKQAARFNAEFLTEDVTEVDVSSQPFTVTAAGTQYQAKALIVTTGARAIMLGLPREEVLIGHGLSTCATCDGFFFTGKEVAVVGGGDSAMEEALFLAKFASKVTVLVRSEKLRASQIMQERAKAHEKINFIYNVNVQELLGEAELTGVKLVNTAGQTQDLPLGGLFYAIGHKPNTDIFVGKLDMDEQGYILTHDGTKTSVEGVFAAGDVQDHVYRQAITSAGSGCMAAIDAERWLAHHHA